MVDRPAPVIDGGSAFADRLRRWRVEAGLTQEQLGELAGLSARTVSDLERGVRRYPYRDTRQRLADALGLDDAQRAAMHVGARVSGLRLAPAAESTMTRRLRLPAELSSFVGRDSELEVLDELLAQAFLAGPTLESTQQRLTRENDSLRAALRWLLDQDEIEAAQRLDAVLGHF